MTDPLQRIMLALALVFPVFDAAAQESRDPWLRPDVVPSPAHNQPTPARAHLGKVLFFDPRLSGSNWISCGSCHNPGLAWSDGLPKGFGEGMTSLPRNTPTILNTAYAFTLMWDGRKASLEEQALGPIEAMIEMNQPLDTLPAKLEQISGYLPLFEAAYPGQGITLQTIAMAIANYERTLVSTESPFDRWRRGDQNAISAAAKNGFALFQGKANCVSCHMGWNFTDNGFHNIGLVGDDEGRHAQRRVAVLKGAFKTPTLRDVALTAPYMHDGSYATLEQVVQHYNRGGDAMANLDPNMKPLNLSADEVSDLVKFMQALTGDPEPTSLPLLPR